MQASSASNRIEDPVALEILWGGLVSVVKEISSTLERLAFSALVRESKDYCVVILDAEGGLVAQNDTAPAFLFTSSVTVREALRKWPADSWRPGTVVITNDPWIATGHVNDLTVITPIFREKTLTGFVVSVAHTVDIGGIMWSGSARSVYEEGLCLPLVELCEEGRDVEPVWRILAANVRVPELVERDLRAQVLANKLGAERVVEFLTRNRVDDFKLLSRAIQDRSEAVLRDKISEVPNGEYPFTVTADGIDEPLVIKVLVTVKDRDISVDYDGTSGQVDYGINCVLTYATALTLYPLQCMLFADIPCNDGCFRPFTVSAPKGSLLNPTRPAPVGGRHSTGHLLHGAIFGALAEAMPDAVMAVCGPYLTVVLNGRRPSGDHFSTVVFASGGWGARAMAAGNSVLSWPPADSNVPIEVIEQDAPIVVEQKSRRRHSGGEGHHVGGDGQRIVMRVVGDEPIWMSSISQRLEEPPVGLLGGRPGRAGSITVNEEPVVPQGVTRIGPGDVICVETAGGGGFGPIEGAETP